MKCQWCGAEKENELGLCLSCCRFPNIVKTTEKIRFLGDVHGGLGNNMAIYLEMINEPGVERSIQVGDFGAGFTDLPEMDDKHVWIRGNHDDPEVCKNHPNWIKDGTTWLASGRVNYSMLFVGGAMSIDKNTRIQGKDWWPEEELEIGKFYEIMDTYSWFKPDVMVTHDCPNLAGKELFGENRMYREGYESRTRQALDAMFEIYQPKLWVFGHWHENKRKVINGTEFICVGKNKYIDLEIGW